ncbi:MAG: DNA topoisomerase-3, partial [Colwellia sp.]
VVNKINNQQGKVLKVNQDKKHQKTPLLFSLSGLQISAAKAFGMSAKQVLDICQQLYEKHKLITYPRSDCQYLPTDHINDIPSVTKAIKSISSKLATMLIPADLKLKSRVWNDKKVSAHHAIIPTSKGKPTGVLSSDEKRIYELVARQYIAQFYPDFEYTDKQIDTEIAGGLFISRQKDILTNGWKDLFQKPYQDKGESEFSSVKLPNVNVGDIINCINGELIEKNTTPPKHFTDATILAALTGISRYVTDNNVKKLLKDTDGLGTEATRANIIELLFKRQFLTRQGKEIRATDVGRKLIIALPLQISQPDMTALWESQLESISNQTVNYQSFIVGVEENLKQLITNVKGISFTGLPMSPPVKYKNKFVRKRVTKK